MEIIGKVIMISEPRSGVSKTTGNPWMTQDYVIETQEQFPKKMMFNVFGEEKIKQFNIQAGEEIKVYFDINAREYQGKYYNDIRAWRIDRPPFDEGGGAIPTPFSAAPTPAAPQTTTQFPPAQQTAVQTADENEDDLPF